MIHYDREVFFDSVRPSLFSGTMNQEQVDGMTFILDTWEESYNDWDVRWLAYALATTYHETSKEMQPIEEYGKGEGMDYGSVDSETGQTYYGRGFVQLTWRDNYCKADVELGYDENPHEKTFEWNAANALDPCRAAEVMFTGMAEGWFRSDSEGPQTFDRYFDEDSNDPYGAREIINGDKTKIPTWSNGVSIGNLIKGYHKKFLSALQAAEREDIEPVPSPDVEGLIELIVIAPPGLRIKLRVVHSEAMIPDDDPDEPEAQ